MRRVGMHIYVLPNLLTTINMFFGFFAIIQSINGNFTWAAYAIVVGAIFDQLDGRVARATNSVSRFGAEYDSLSDLVTWRQALCFSYGRSNRSAASVGSLAFFMSLAGPFVWRVLMCKANRLRRLTFKVCRFRWRRVLSHQACWPLPI